MDTSNSGMQEREREVGLVPSGIHYVPAVAAGIAVAEVVGSVVAAFVGDIVAWDISASGAVVAVVARCVVP